MVPTRLRRGSRRGSVNSVVGLGVGAEIRAAPDEYVDEESTKGTALSTFIGTPLPRAEQRTLPHGGRP